MNQVGNTVNLSRADGVFDLGSIGGEVLTVKYERKGYLSAQRQVNVPAGIMVWAPDDLDSERS